MTGFALPLVLVLLACAVGCVSTSDPAPHDALDSLADWRVELEAGGMVTARNGALEIDVPAGCTVWYAKPLRGPVQIDYDVVAISAGGPNDRVSDLNCFWMATDARNPADLFAVARNGKFADYNPLRCYYASIGGNTNTTTRFRRYIGSPTTRPLLAEHDRTSPLLVPNVPQHLTLVANGTHISFSRDGEVLFDFTDADPYTLGHFAFRTVTSHFRITNFRITPLMNR